MPTNKQRVFIAEYLKDFNATQAAIRAGYSKKTARAIGHENLTKPDISEEIKAAIEERQMGADEALSLMADIARGDMADLMDVTSVGWALDMAKAQERGKTKLIKKVKQTTITKIGRKQDDDDEERTYLEIELYPADAAIRDILKVHGRLVDRKDITTNGEPIGINGEQYNRAISSFADAVRDSVFGQTTKEASEVDATE